MFRTSPENDDAVGAVDPAGAQTAARRHSGTLEPYKILAVQNMSAR